MIDTKENKQFQAQNELVKNLYLLEKVVLFNNKDKMSRILRNNSRIRPSIKNCELYEVIEKCLAPVYEENKKLMLDYLSTLPQEAKAINVDDKVLDSTDSKTELSKTVEDKKKFDLPEVEVYLYLLVFCRLFRCNKKNEMLDCVTKIIQVGNDSNRRTLDLLMAKAYSYLSLYHEKFGKFESLRGFVHLDHRLCINNFLGQRFDFRYRTLLQAHRTACLHHNEIGQATLLNLLLRNYLSDHLYDQAFKLVSKTTFPENASNNQFVRYLYYVGKIQAIQLDYTSSFTKLMQSIRKAPQNTAIGFHREVNKLAIIVQLLMGEIPERTMFTIPELSESLTSYFELTNAVRVGNLDDFNTVLNSHSKVFEQDNMTTLILRLRHNVIKTGLRKINVSYSRISFKDICAKLCLDTTQNAEFVCAKAIYDGVIDASIDHKNGWMKSKETADIYGSNEPQQAFHKRITFCLDVHDEAVKAMRYPPDSYKKDLESAEERQEREKQEEELAKEIEDEMDE